MKAIIVLPPYMRDTKLKVSVYDNPQTTMIFSQGSVHTLEAGMIGVVNVYNSDSGRGIFTVDTRGTKVSFAPGNLNSSNVFETSQVAQGSTFTSIPTNTSSDWTLLTDEEWRYLLWPVRIMDILFKYALQWVKSMVLFFFLIIGQV